MCKMFAAAGTFGDLTVPVRRELHNFLTDMFRATAYDGGDQSASGFYAWSGDRRLTGKSGVDAARYVAESDAWNSWKENPPKLLICHARGASAESAAVMHNNHPFVGENVALAHEGWISDHEQHAKTRGLHLTTTTDSEYYMRFADVRRPALGDRKAWTPESCMKSMLNMTTEATALQLINHSDDYPSIWFGKNDSRANHRFAIYEIPRFLGVFLVSEKAMMNIALGVNDIPMEEAKLLHEPKPFELFQLNWLGCIQKMN